jgi:Fe-Mn family superoxide dismutase
MKQADTYTSRPFDLHGLNGISDRTIEMHMKLYEGYVMETNRLTHLLRDFLKDGHVDQEKMPAYSELKRRLGFEYNGMILHEYYFDNLVRAESNGSPRNASFRAAAEESFGSYEIWKADFIGVCKMRGVGWAVCYQHPQTGHLSNHWVTLHEIGNVAGFVPTLVMDAWEHAFILDYRPSERGEYVDAFFSNINWKVVDERVTRAQAAVAAHHA